MLPDRFLQAIGISLAIVSLLAGCQPASEQPVAEVHWFADRSILTDDPCAAPCWQGITPGETPLDEAFDILTELGYEPRYVGNWGNQIGWVSPLGYPESGLQRIASQLFSLQIVGPVGFLDVALEFDLTLGEVMDKYGIPEKYHLYKSEGTLVGGGHTPVVAVFFYYAQRGLVFAAFLPISDPGSETVVIDANTTLTRVYYFVPTSVERLVDDVYLLKGRIRWEEPLDDWQGLPIEFHW